MGRRLEMRRYTSMQWNKPLMDHPLKRGLAQDVAERIAREGKRRHFSPRVLAMDAFPATLLPQQRLVIFICSTTGQAGSIAICTLHL